MRFAGMRLFGRGGRILRVRPRPDGRQEVRLGGESPTDEHIRGGPADLAATLSSFALSPQTRRS